MSFTTTNYEAVRTDGDAQSNVLRPQVLAAGDTDTAWVTMAGYRWAEFLVQLGEMADAATAVDIAVLQATDNAGTGAKPLAGRRGAKQATQIIAGADFATEDDQVRVNVRAEEMDVNNGFNFLACRITVSAGDTAQAAVAALRGIAEYLPVTTTYVTEVVD